MWKFTLLVRAGGRLALPSKLSLDLFPLEGLLLDPLLIELMRFYSKKKKKITFLPQIPYSAFQNYVQVTKQDSCSVSLVIPFITSFPTSRKVFLLVHLCAGFM